MSISQIATKTVSDQDSTVVMSKKLVGYMIEDLIKSDADKAAIKLLEQNLTFKDGIIIQKDEIKNAQMYMFIHLNNLPYGLEYLEKRQSAEDFSQQYYNETYGGNK